MIMAKLFSLEQFEPVEQIDSIYKDIPDNQELNRDITEEVSEAESDLSIIMESFAKSSSDLDILNNIKMSMCGQKEDKIPYFNSLNNYRPVVDNIAKNLGFKNRTPCLEDFQNPYGFKASHEIAMEGFGDFIKRIWEKIKDLAHAFFKKVMLFFKRLLGHDLELENYEEYLAGMISKIKGQRLNISDNKVPLDSKLPSLLAEEGMESINSDYVLTMGLSKVKQIAHLLDTVFTQKLDGMGKNLSAQFGESLAKMITVMVENYANDDVMRDAFHGFKMAALDPVKGVFQHTVTMKQLDEQAYNAIMHHYTRDDFPDTEPLALVNSDDVYQKLPKNFNVYFFVGRESKKMFVCASTESNTYVKNVLNPISSRDNLVKFYDDYKKIVKRVDISRLNKTVGQIEKAIDHTIGIIRNDMRSAMDYRQPVVDQLDISSLVMTEEEFETAVGQYADITSFMDLLDNKTYNDYVSDSELRKKVNIVVTGQSGNDSKPIDLANNQQYRKRVEELQNYLLGYVSALQTMLKEIATNLTSIYTELRYELVKYIYNSAKLYK